MLLDKRDMPLKIPLVASLGGLLELFDFSLFLFLLDPISNAFFPKESFDTAFFKSLIIFSIGYLVRPLGGAFFGHLGDRIGRKKTFQISLVLMSVSSLFIAAIPNVNSIGLWAPILLLLLRLLQGFSLGGEIPGAATFSIEHFPKKRGAILGLLFMGVTWGMLLASLVIGGLKLILTPAEFTSYGWRFCFVIGGLAGMLVLWLRSSFTEPDLFKRFMLDKKKLPIADLFRYSWSKVLKAFFSMALTSGTIFLIVRVPSYISVYSNVKIVDESMFSTFVFLIYGVFVFFSGWLSDFLGRKNTMLMAAVFGGIGSLVFFLWFPCFTGIADVYVFMAIWLLIMSLSNGTYACFAIERFPTRHRLSGFAVSYNLSFAIFGGLMPLLLTSAIDYYASPIVLGVYVFVLALSTFVSVLISKDYKEEDLEF